MVTGPCGAASASASRGTSTSRSSTDSRRGTRSSSPTCGTTSISNRSRSNRKPEEKSTMIQMEQVTKKYRTERVETTALDNINLAIDKGEFVSIMGPSGCGKSTLLHLMGLLDEPSTG